MILQTFNEIGRFFLTLLQDDKGLDLFSGGRHAGDGIPIQERTILKNPNFFGFLYG